MGTARERKALQGASRFDLEENYVEFERIHGFDIRDTRGDLVHSTVQDSRDPRDPQQIGELILNRPEGMTALEVVEQIEEHGVDVVGYVLAQLGANGRSLNGKANGR